MHHVACAGALQLVRIPDRDAAVSTDQGWLPTQTHTVIEREGDTLIILVKCVSVEKAERAIELFKDALAESGTNGIRLRFPNVTMRA